LRHPPRKARVSHGLFRQGVHRGHQGDELLGHRRHAGLLPGEGETMDFPPRGAHRGYEDDEERSRALGHRRSVPGGSLLTVAVAIFGRGAFLGLIIPVTGQWD
jgi:hypothetical protein